MAKLAEKHLVVKPSTKKKFKLWMIQNEISTWDEGLNELLDTLKKKKAMHGKHDH